MNLLEKFSAKLPFSKKSAQPEYFFALNIGLSELSAAVWSLYSNQLEVLSETTLPYENHEELLDRAYQALDKSLGVLEIEPKKVLFGVPDSWGIDDNLKEPYLKLLRQILKEADLEPLAYVTTTNAVSFFLQKEEGVPPTAILLGIGDFIEITLVRGGKIAGTRTASRGEHLFDDVENTLAKFTEVEVLPSKILLYSTKKGEDLVKLKDELMSYPWMSKLSFLHFPKIDLLEIGMALHSVIVAGASEVYPHANLKYNFLSKKTSSLGHGFDKTLKEDPSLESKKISLHRVVKTEKPTKEVLTKAGFVQGDIKEEVEVEHEEMPAREMEDVEDDNLISPEEKEDFIPVRGPLVKRSAPLSDLDVPATLFHQVIKTAARPFKKAFSFLIVKGLIVKLALIPLLVLAASLAYLFLVKATITVFVEPRILERDAAVVADPTATIISEEQKVIPGKTVEISMSASGKDTASGSKQIGDPAKGKVIVYNLTSNKVSFSQGSTLSSGSYKFTLDSSVSIASQSASAGADFITVFTPGKSDSVGVTASTVGPENNLPAGAELTLGNYSKSQVVAKVSDALSGGTAKTVTMVVADDQKRLKAKVLDDLKQQAAQKLQGELTDGRKIISDALLVVDGQYTFSKAVGDQAKEFSLSASVKFKGTSYNDADLRTIVSKLVSIEVPSGFELNLQNAETQADIAKVDKDGKLTFKARFRAKLLPKIDTDKLRNQIRGKNISQTVEDLKKIDNVIGSEINIKPSLPGPLSRLPLLSSNITVIVTPK